MMNPVEKTLPLWTAEPRRTGLPWLAGNLARVIRQIYISCLSRFISVLGEMSTPGMKPVGAMQAWALRRMGVTCPSSQIWVGPRVRFDYPEQVVFGRRVVLGADSRLTARSQIIIGDDFLSAPGLYLNTGTHDLSSLVPQSFPIRLGAGIWCGTRVTICAGAKIGDGAVIGAGSVVLHEIPAHHLATGTPCKPRRALAAERDPARQWSNFRQPESVA
jgi:acetyltransferase-like isoleucine patch superfamily enzyme